MALDMAGSAYATTDRVFIRKWIERRGGQPGRFANAQRCVLCIDFPGRLTNVEVVALGWDEFFSELEQQSLAFLYQETTAAGQESYLWRLVDRGTVREEPPVARRLRRASPAQANR
jgi:hypothetical protein